MATIKEITQLRKGGHLDQATEAAEAEFARNANLYTAGALFWCLNDYAKKESDVEVLKSLIDRMETLYKEHAPTDTFMPQSLKLLQLRLNPLAIRIKNAIEMAKTGSVDMDLLEELRSSLGNGTLDGDLYRDFGWLLYFALKNMHEADFRRRKILLYTYFLLRLPAPSLLHSLILGEAIVIEKNTPLQFRIRDFMNLWGWDNLTEDDWKQYHSDNGHTASSRVEKLISVYTKELKVDNVEVPEVFENLVNKALEVYPESQHLPFFKAVILKLKGENEAALDYYKNLILKTPVKGYLWHQASALVTEPETRIALLCKAISLVKDETFKGNFRLDLAKALIQKGMYGNAKYELDIYRRHYASQGWNLKREFLELENALPQTVSVEDNKPLYERYISVAEEFIYSSIPSVIAIKVAHKLIDDRNHRGRKIMQWTLRKREGVLTLRNPGRYGLDGNARNGSTFEVKLHEGRVVWIKKSQSNPLLEDWIKMATGSIELKTDRNGNPYAIIDRIYIGRKLLGGISNNEKVKIIALQQEDGRWSAIALRRE